MKKPIVVEIIVGLLVLLFTYTALSKLFEYKSFLYSLKHAPLTMAHASILSLLVPVIELITVSLLLFKSSRYWGLRISLILMITFTAYIGYMLVFIPQLPCSCGGVIKKMSWPQHLVFNIIFTLLTLSAIWVNKRYPHLENK